MNFKELLNLTEQKRETADSFRTTGQAMKKESAKTSSGDNRAKDAARKRAERARQIPRSRKPKEELVKEVIAVRTQDGRIQLIFKDSFDKNKHTKLNRGDGMSMEEARALTKDNNFEQTGASKLLFGDVKTTEKKEKEGSKEEKVKPVARKTGEKEEPEEREEKQKARKLSKDEIFGLMTQMSPEQLINLPLDVRQEYFKKTRNPPANHDFDAMSFESLANKFGINPISSTNFNQQVLNALMFLAKIKAGASTQEMETYTTLAPGSLDFTKKSFEQAKKILSQIGEECIQNLVSSIENGTKTQYAEGNVDMECGKFKFKVSAGGEFSLTTDKFDQSSKSFRGLIANAINQAFTNPNIRNDPKVQNFLTNIQEVGSKFSTTLLSRDSLAAIENNPQLKQQLQSMQIVDSQGNSIGTLFDDKGKLNKLASLENYESQITKSAPALFKNSPNKPSEFTDTFVKALLKTYYRGDNIKKPEMAPTHLITQNGIFPMNDAYFDEISKTATVSLKPTSALADKSNLEKRKDYQSELLRKFTTVVEETEKAPSAKDLFVNKDEVDPLAIAMRGIVNGMDFDVNASLLPGFTPKELNTIQYNYVRIGGKTVKIPVEKTESLSEGVLQNATMLVNDLIVESLSNNFVLNTLLKSKLLRNEEAAALFSPQVLNEDDSYLKTIYRNVLHRANDKPLIFMAVMNKINTAMYEEYKRNYKMEYRNYHGKPKQRKERAARTSAREKLIKKGRVKKGDGKDIDHKKALRHGGSNGINNLRVRDKSANRSDNGHKKGEKQNKDWK